MAITQGNLGVVKNNLQLYYNRESVKSFRGEATTNQTNNTTDFTGTSYAQQTEWSSDPTRFTKTYNSSLQTPIGTGATLLTESGTAGYHHISRWGGSELGGNSLSCYVYPVTNNVTNFSVGMLGDSDSTAVFNLVTGALVSAGSRVSNTFITKVSGWNGWYRVGANIGGRTGGWVGAMGLDVQTSYTPSTPYRSMYVTGVQYEAKTYCTPFVVSTRSANTYAGGGGLIDLSGNNYTADLNSAAVAFDSGGFYFNGDAAGALTTPVANSTLDSLSNNTHTYEVWFKLLGTPPGTYDGYFFGRQGFHEGFAHNKSTPGTIFTLTWYSDNTATGLGYTASLNTWYYGTYVVNVETATRKLYINGSLVNSGTLTKQLKQFTSPYYVGAASSAYAGNCIVSVARAHNRELTAAEITRNFESQRKAYGI